MRVVVGCNKGQGTPDLTVEGPELATMGVGATLEQAERWIQQWGRQTGGGSSGHLLLSTSAKNNIGK